MHAADGLWEAGALVETAMYHVWSWLVQVAILGTKRLSEEFALRSLKIVRLIVVPTGDARVASISPRLFDCCLCCTQWPLLQ